MFSVVEHREQYHLSMAEQYSTDVETRQLRNNIKKITAQKPLNSVNSLYAAKQCRDNIPSISEDLYVC